MWQIVLKNKFCLKTIWQFFSEKKGILLATEFLFAFWRKFAPKKKKHCFILLAILEKIIN
jgi:glutathionylspermidine synthase